jgi:hypothetical protein
MGNGGPIDIGNIGSDFVEDGKVLRQLHDEDPAEFARVATQSGIGLRKAYYLVEIDRALESYPVPKEKMLSIGWTKLQMISAHITKKNYRILLSAGASRSQGLGSRRVFAPPWALEANRRRDETILARLAETGWGVLVVWECQLRDAQALEARIGEFLG